MIVTVMSDASFCHTTKASGWGIWIRSDRGIYEAGGKFKNQPESATEAEAMALSIAVFAAFRQGIAEPGDRLIVQTDCMQNIHAYDGAKRRRSKLILDTVKYTKDLIAEKKCTFEIRHVRAHDPKAGKRNYINDVCDKLAKKAMRKIQRERRAQNAK